MAKDASWHITLPAVLDIPATLALHSHWHTQLPLSGQCKVDASGLERIGAAGVQMLLSLAQTAIAQHSTFQIHHPSQALREAVKTLGLESVFLPHYGPSE